MNPLHFAPNIPQTLSLSDPSGVPEDFNVSYPTETGATLLLPRSAALQLNALDLQPGESFTICHRWSGRETEPMVWDIALTVATERSRADAEAAKLKPGELPEPIRPHRGRPRKIHPPVAISEPSTASEQLPPTGTYGPVPRLAVARQLCRNSIPFNIAFSEVTRFVTQGLKDSGEQWNDEAKQAAVCTILIAAAKQGFLGVWER